MSDILEIINQSCKMYKKQFYQEDLRDVKITDEFEKDLGLDSLARISVFMEVVKRLGIDMTSIDNEDEVAAEIDGVQTVSQAVEICERLNG